MPSLLNISNTYRKLITNNALNDDKSDSLMRCLNEVIGLKFTLLIFRQLHGAITRSQKNNVYEHTYDSA